MTQTNKFPLTRCLVATCVAFLAVGLLAFQLPSSGSADLQTVGKARKQRLVKDQFAAEQQAAFEIFAKRCTKCHAMSRPIAALNTGITPVSGGDFNKKGIKKYVVKMMRKPNSGIDRKDAKTIIKFLLHAREVADSQ